MIALRFSQRRKSGAAAPAVSLLCHFVQFEVGGKVGRELLASTSPAELSRRLKDTIDERGDFPAKKMVILANGQKLDADADGVRL